MVCIATSEKFLRGSRTTPYVDQPASRVERRFPGVPPAETGIARSAAGGGPAVKRISRATRQKCRCQHHELDRLVRRLEMGFGLHKPHL
jgi:hypothetical protein